jgi:DNA-binding MarR family transcriptional regulator
MIPADEARLSPLQKAILRAVWTETVRLERALAARGAHRLLARGQSWGVDWEPSREQERWTPVARATVSRALRRLEQRGLVEHTNPQTGTPGRPIRVRLTERGREVAERLIKWEADR